MEARAVNSDGMMPITIQSLVKNSLRMRPDRIIVGEIRDGTIVDLMSAMSTGHEGSMSTIHANSPKNLVRSRIPILYSMNPNFVFSEDSQNVQISEALQLIVQITRLTNGERKITHITEVQGLEKSKIFLKDIFVYDVATKSFKSTGYIPKRIIDIAKKNGVDIDKNLFKEV
jgi:Flp pilus assembly CpaF family ATPase